MENWFEKDISKGVMCRVRNGLRIHWQTAVIFDYQCQDSRPFKAKDFYGRRSSFVYAEPLSLTKKQLGAQITLLNNG